MPSIMCLHTVVDTMHHLQSYHRSTFEVEFHIFPYEYIHCTYCKPYVWLRAVQSAVQLIYRSCPEIGGHAYFNTGSFINQSELRDHETQSTLSENIIDSDVHVAAMQTRVRLSSCSRGRSALSLDRPPGRIVIPVDLVLVI